MRGLPIIRPRTRGDCYAGPRPCPWVSCRHHLYLDVRGSRVTESFPGREPWELEESCSLDLADRGERTLDGVAQVFGLSRERVRQVEERALRVLAGRVER